MSNTDYSDSTIPFDVYEIRKQFPILDQEINGKPLVYLDNAATTQKPYSVINSIHDYYTGYNSNIHRGVHSLAYKATNAFEDSRDTVRKFLNAAENEEIIFTYGTTDSINLVAQSYGRKYINKGDEIIISGLEHHSNIVPWHLLSKEKGAKIKVIPVLESGDLDLEAYSRLLNKNTKLVSVSHVSNALGTIIPVKEIISMAHNMGAVVLVDGAQAAAHMDLDVQELNSDFYAFSAHKAYGPTGVGILYGKRELLEKTPPYRGGGEMIKEVTFEDITLNDLPYKFEAGTPNIADIIALNASLDFVDKIPKDRMADHEMKLLDSAQKSLSKHNRVRIFGEAKEKIGILSFVIDGLHHFDVGMMLDTMGIAVRTGHHCAQPIMDHFSIEGTIRVSFSVYNTIEDIEAFTEGIDKILKRF